MAKWKSIKMGNHNQPSNVNPNVQMIYVESWEPIIVVLTMGDVATWWVVRKQSISEWPQCR